MRCVGWKLEKVVETAQANANRTRKAWVIFTDTNGVYNLEPEWSTRTVEIQGLFYPENQEGEA